jgi:hypothetical protein
MQDRKDPRATPAHKDNAGLQGPKDDIGPQVSILQKPKKTTVLEDVIRDTYGH